MTVPVSIPKRVTAKVERPCPYIGITVAIVVSIPKRVTAKVERPMDGYVEILESLFQSLKGLQPKWNPRLSTALRLFVDVSIPKRVTAKVEQMNNHILYHGLSFNP